MKTLKKLSVLTVTGLFLLSCAEEARKLKQAKNAVSNTATIVEKAQEAKKDIENLKDATPLTNAQLKEWLPQSADGLERTGFKVGTAGYANVASIEGTYKTEQGAGLDETHNNDVEVIEKKLIVNIIDGAGPTGSVMIAGLGMASKMDMEQEDEFKHTQMVNIDGTRAQQTFHKKRNETALQFVYNKRFGVMVNGVHMDPEETWEKVKKLNLGRLTDITE